MVKTTPYTGGVEFTDKQGKEASMAQVEMN